MSPVEVMDDIATRNKDVAAIRQMGVKLCTAAWFDGAPVPLPEFSADYHEAEQRLQFIKLRMAVYNDAFAFAMAEWRRA